MPKELCGQIDHKVYGSGRLFKELERARRSLVGSRVRIRYGPRGILFLLSRSNERLLFPDSNNDRFLGSLFRNPSYRLFAALRRLFRSLESIYAPGRCPECFLDRSGR